MTKKLLGLVAALVGAVGFVYAVGITNPFVNESALAYSKRYTIDLQNAAVNTVSATAVYSSYTATNATFSTGRTSAGSFAVADNTILSTATAINNIVVASTSGALGDSIVITKLNKPGAYILTAGRDWNYKATTALTAASIKIALDKLPDMATSRGANILYSTAAATGANYNAIRWSVSNTDTLTLAHATFSGGRNATVVSVNGYAFKAGVNFPIGPTADDTASNLSTAINAKAVLKDQVTASPTTNSVGLVSDKVGTVSNFSLATSNASAISKSGTAMTSATNAAWTLGSKNITVAANGYTLALPLLYRPGSGAAVISGLTAETTYYAIPVDANTLQLASSSSNAQAGTGIVLASTSTLASAKTYALLPLTFTAAATTGGKWQVSNDNSTWSDLSVSSFSWIGGGSVSGSINWDLGKLNFRYLSLNVVGPSAGGLGLTVTAQGSYTP